MSALVLDQRLAAAPGREPSAGSPGVLGAAVGGRRTDRHHRGPGVRPRRATTSRRTPTRSRFAYDKDPKTRWRTVQYLRNPKLGGIKRGVGLVLDLGTAQPVREVQLTLSGTGTDVELRVPAKDPAGTTTPPMDSDEDWRSVAEQSKAGGTATLQPSEPVTTRYVLVYLTSLPKEGTGYRGGIFEVEVRQVSQGVDPHSVPSPTVPPAGPPTGAAVDPDADGATIPPDPAGQARNDAELLRAHVDGDAEAFAILVHRHQDRLWAIALRVMRNPDDAADALQDAYIAAFRRAGSFRGDAAVTTWLHRVVVNACLDRLRSLKVRAADALPEDLDRVARCWEWSRRPTRWRRPSSGTRCWRRWPGSSRPAGGAGAGRHAGVLGRGGGDHPGLRAGDGEEPLRPRTGQARAVPHRPESAWTGTGA